MLIGHKPIINSLRKLADSRRLNHAYVFFGPEGVGKFLTARGIANYLEIGEFKTSPGVILSDLLIIEPDEKGTIGIDAIRDIRHFLLRRPNRSEYRTVIIDNSEALTAEAQNALLKITEEPRESGLLILIIREPEMLLATLSSRLYKVYFSTIRIAMIKEWLMREFLVSANDAERLAAESGGRPGLALKFRDRNFIVLKKKAEKFLKISRSERRQFIKELLAPEDFNVLPFLDVLILQITNCLRIEYNQLRNYENMRKRELSFNLWHRMIELKKNSSYFNLNPRIQLQTILEE